jgi:hypothetical protein
LCTNFIIYIIIYYPKPYYEKSGATTFTSILFCFCGIVHAQSRIEGKISDVKDQLKLHNATIMLLTAKDSILTNFARSDEKVSSS